MRVGVCDDGGGGGVGMRVHVSGAVENFMKGG